MITPPTLLNLVHAVQQPIGHPAFTALAAQHVPYGSLNNYGQVDELINPDPDVLQTIPESGLPDATETAAITAWRKAEATEVFLLGGLQIHAASTGKVDLLAEWDDPYDDLTGPRQEGMDYSEKNTALADEILIPTTNEGYLFTGDDTTNYRQQAYYDADHDLLCFAATATSWEFEERRDDIRGYAPRHALNDTATIRCSIPLGQHHAIRNISPGPKTGLYRSSQPVQVEVQLRAPAAPW